MIEGLSSYAAYRAAELPWAPRIPEHWLTERGKALFAESNLPVAESDEIVTCFRDGQVTLRKNRRVGGFMLALYEAGYQGVRRGQLVIHAMDAFAGAVGVSDSDGKCTPEYIVCDPRSPVVFPPYYALALRYAAFQDFIRISCPAVRERAPRFRYPNFGDMQLPLPPREEQQSIVNFIADATARIERVVLSKRRIAALLAEEREAVTEEALRADGTMQYRLGVAAKRVNRPINVTRGRFYTTIGLFNRGRGIFHKAPRTGMNLGDSSFGWIEEGDLVISGQFAWEGAIALAGAEDTGCIASHRYPILRGAPGLATSPYLLAFLKSQYGEQLLEHHSRGAAGRNRPLNARTLLKEKIPVPPSAEQERIGELVRLEGRVSASITKMVKRVREYQAKLISDVVTGQLDVREAARSIPDDMPIVPPDLDGSPLDDEEVAPDSP